jgi:hypothetical protein
VFKLYKSLLLNLCRLKQVQSYGFDNFHPNTNYILVSVGIYTLRESIGKVIPQFLPSLKEGGSLGVRR